jgi:hypothetical protein
VDAGSTPQGIRCDHFPDEGGDRPAQNRRSVVRSLGRGAVLL